MDEEGIHIKSTAQILQAEEGSRIICTMQVYSAKSPIHKDYRKQK